MLTEPKVYSDNCVNWEEQADVHRAGFLSPEPLNRFSTKTIKSIYLLYQPNPRTSGQEIMAFIPGGGGGGVGGGERSFSTFLKKKNKFRLKGWLKQ
jgi:hypothetical protein